MFSVHYVFEIQSCHLCCYPAKPSVKRSCAPPAVDVRRPSAPVFLESLQDLRVMDGSQVTMTVEVTGIT